MADGTDAAPPGETEFYLWHLCRMGLLDPLTRQPAGDLWQAAREARPVLVALIDTGVDAGHPNLQGALLPQVDFGPRLGGVVYGPDRLEIPRSEDEREALLAAFALAPSETRLRDRFARVMAGQFERLDLPDPSLRFGAHGTACAGLVGGRPGAGRGGVIPYFGANPYCRILPIATPYSHEILPVIHALLLAWAAGAEVILMPRGLPDPAGRARLMRGSPHATRIEIDDGTRLPEADQACLARLRRHQRLFEHLLLWLSGQSLVVLAAGNEGRAAPAYPASLLGLRGGGDLLVVRARNRQGEAPRYSNGAGMAGLVEMISDDDPPAAGQRPGWGILSLDVRGAYGYAAGPGGAAAPGDGESGGPGALYSLFGGTSAASALAAGVLSLLLQAGRLAPSSPGEARAALAAFAGAADTQATAVVL